MSRDFTAYAQVLPSFVCWNCSAVDRMLKYSSKDDTVLCGRCGAIYQRKDAVSGKPMWVTNGRHAVLIESFDDDELNDLIALMLLKPDLKPGQLVRLLDELEKRQSREQARTAV
jgi:hypothetical protein